MTRSTLWQDGVPSKSLTLRTDINIPELRNGKGVPNFCVQLFRLADFFQLDELKSKATKELEVYFDNTIAFSNAEKAETRESPQWLTNTLGAVEDAYKDNNTAPILKTLPELIYKNSHRILRFKDAVDSFDKIPEFAKDLVKNHIVDDLTKRPSLRSFKFRLGLPVLAAMRYAGISYEAGDEKASPFGSAKMPCLLYPNLGVSSFIFTSAEADTERELPGLQWLAPSNRDVLEMTYHPDSEIVQVRMFSNPPLLYIRFGDCGDARVCVERYCRTNPGINQVTAPDSASLSRMMRRFCEELNRDQQGGIVELHEDPREETMALL
jgi:hypothetical protein